MAGPSNAQIASQVSTLITSWQNREDQYRAWLGGVANGGPNGDGRYPLTDVMGTVHLTPCPAALSDTVGGPAAAAGAALAASIAARDVAATEAASSEAQRVLAEAARSAALTARDQALLARDGAQNAEANALVHRGAAELARIGTAEDLLGTALNLEDSQYALAWTYNYMIDAQAAAEAAGNYNPALYATRADGLTQIDGLQDALNARIASGSAAALGSLTLDTWLSAAGGAFSVTSSGNLTANSLSSSAVTATGAVSTTGGTLKGQLEHTAGHFFFRPINNTASYDDGSFLRGYYRGSTGNLVLTKVGGSGPPLGILLEGVGQVWHSGSFNPVNKADALHSHDWAQVTGKPAFLTKFSIPTGQWTRHQTAYGYIDFGPVNASYAHIYTDRPAFYFNAPILVSGVRVPRITASTSGPSGGEDGDIHITY